MGNGPQRFFITPHHGRRHVPPHPQPPYVRACERACVVGDMPFESLQASIFYHIFTEGADVLNILWRGEKNPGRRGDVRWARRRRTRPKIWVSAPTCRWRAQRPSEDAQRSPQTPPDEPESGPLLYNTQGCRGLKGPDPLLITSGSPNEPTPAAGFVQTDHISISDAPPHHHPPPHTQKHTDRSRCCPR